MRDILKRLKIIKECIELGDDEFVFLQADRLSSVDDSEISTIVELLAKKEYIQALNEIESYEERYKDSVVLYEDREVTRLKIELKILEEQIQYLSEQKSLYLNSIEEFNTLYNLELGSYIKKILKLKEELLKQFYRTKESLFEQEKQRYHNTKESYEELKEHKEKLEKALDGLDDFDDTYDEAYQKYKDVKEKLEEVQETLDTQRKKAKDAKSMLEADESYKELEEAREDFKEFSQEYEEILEKDSQKIELSEKEKEKLKKLYRKASRLCHPDIVADELKIQALKIMQQLNEAYSIHDLPKVEKILKDLESGAGFEVASENIDDKDILKAKIDNLKRKTDEINSELDDIKSDETFQTIQELDDIDEYFESLKENLDTEYQRLKTEKNTFEEKNDEMHDVY